MAEARYAGLTYASVAGDRGAGGWQVHSRSPGLGGDEERLLTEHVVTGFDSHRGALPPFVEPEALAALPVRFSAEPVAGGTVIRHAVQAGADATGRPGNVFTTVLLDRLAGTPPLPIRLWRSTDLLVPFGAAEVTSAVPRWDVRPGTAVDATAVASLVTDPDRWALLAVLLDAVAASAAGGPTVVLRARDQDEAARWIGAVCLLTAPAWSARLHWSLYERAEAVDGARRRGAHLVVVPVEDEPAAGPDLVVLDADEQPALGVLGGTDHVTVRGRRVPATGWSELVTELYPLETEDVARLLEDIGRAEGPVADGEPAWWLAAGLIGATACPPDLADAAAALLRRTPAPAVLGDRQLALLDGVLGDGGSSAAELRAALDRVRPEDARFALLAERFVRAALADPAWLDAGAADAPPEGRAPRTDRNAVAAALRELPTDGDGAALLPRLGALLDVLRFADVLDAADPRIDEPLVELVLTASAGLDPAQAPELVAIVNRLPAHLRVEVLPSVASSALAGPAGVDAPQLDLPAELRPEQVLQLLDAVDGGRIGVHAADALLASGPEPAVARRLGAVLARPETPRALLRSLHVEDWGVDDRLAAAALQPDVLTEDQLLTAIAAGATEQVSALVRAAGLTESVQAALHLRLQAEDALADEHWRGDLGDGVVLTAADRLAGGSAASAAAVLAPRLRLLPVISLLMTRLRTPPTDSGFEVLLRRRAVGPPLEPLPADAVTLLAGRLSDPVQLPLALAYAASDRSAASEDPLRRGLRSEEGDLLDAAVADVLPQLDEDRRMSIVADAEAVLADRPDGSRLDRLLQRRASPVADYLEDHGLTLPRKVR